MRIPIFMVAITVPLAAQPASVGEKLVAENDCSSCHAANGQSVGPSYAAIAKRYAGQANAVSKLTAKVRKGGSGSWGDIAMTAHPDLTEAQAKQMMTWILSVKATRPAAARAAQVYTYKLKNGTTRQLDFPVYAEGKAPKVTKDIFKGYALYNS